MVYSVLKNRHPYQDFEFNYEALTVNRNAACWIRKLREYGYLPPPDMSPQSRTA